MPATAVAMTKRRRRRIVRRSRSWSSDIALSGITSGFALEAPRPRGNHDAVTSEEPISEWSPELRREAGSTLATRLESDAARAEVIAHALAPAGTGSGIRVHRYGDVHDYA